MATNEYLEEYGRFKNLLQGDPGDPAYRLAVADWMDAHDDHRFRWLREPGSGWIQAGADAVPLLLALLPSFDLHTYQLAEKILAWIGEPAVAGLVYLGETDDDWVRGRASSKKRSRKARMTARTAGSAYGCITWIAGGTRGGVSAV